MLNSYYLLLTTSSHRPTVHDAPYAIIVSTDDGNGNSNSLQSTHNTNERPSLAVVSVCISGPRFTPEYINASLSNKRLFRNRWGAMCVLPSERLDNGDMENYHAKWEKLVYINQTLHMENVDWVLWMDCDAAFTNLEVDWRTHVPLNKSKLMVVSEDKNGINLGVFLVPNTLQSREFVQQLYEKRHYVEQMQFKWKDQSALIELIKDDPNIKTKIEIVPQRKINSFLKDERNKDGKKWQAYDWIMHQVLCREEAMCTSSFIWTLDSVAGREPDYSAFVGSEKRGLQAKETEAHSSLLIPTQSMCNDTHGDIRSAGVRWYDQATNVNIEMYPIGKKTVGVQIQALSSKSATLLRKHIGRKALRTQQLDHLMNTSELLAESFPKMNKIYHVEKAPNYDHYLGCDNEVQSPRGTALLVTQNFGCNNLWHALANHHGVWTLFKVLGISPKDVTRVLPTEYGTPFASPPRTVADVLWPLYIGTNVINEPQQTNCFERLVFIETNLNRPGPYWEQYQVKEQCSFDAPYMQRHEHFHTEAREIAIQVISNTSDAGSIMASKPEPQVICYMSRRLRDERVRYFSEEFAPIIEDVLDIWAAKHNVDFKRLVFDDKVPFSEQIEQTASCSILFGTHGAGFGHLIWMQSGARVIEIGGTVGCELYYRAMASWYGHHYTCFSDLVGHGVKLDEREVYQSLNMTLLLDVLDDAIKSKLKQ